MTEQVLKNRIVLAVAHLQEISSTFTIMVDAGDSCIVYSEGDAEDVFTLIEDGTEKLHNAIIAEQSVE